ncbi:MAG: hypothetical protein ACYC6X_00405 [Minisyncoccota bacterium]
MAFLSVFLMVIAAILAHVDNRWLPGQMMLQHSAKGIPGIANGAWWGNLFLMSPILFLIGFYAEQWSRQEVLATLIIGAVVGSYAFLRVYRFGLHDDAWAGAGEVHPAGVVAMVYTAGLLAAFILFYVCSNVERAHVLIIGVLLVLYLPLANHLVLDFLNGAQHFVWCPQIFKEEVRPMIIMRGGLIFATVITTGKFLFPDRWL